MASRTRTPAKPQDPEVTVAWEDRWRPRAAAAAIIGALFPLVGQVIGTLPFANVQSEEGAQLLAVNDNRAEFLGGAILNFLGLIALGGALYFLFRATKARRPETPSVAGVTAVLGPVLAGLALLARNVILSVQAADFANSEQTFAYAQQLLDAGSLSLTAAIALAGQLALGFAFVLVALNAMRAGLLTRFMGILGILCGVLFVIPLGSPLPIVQGFWLGSLAVLFTGRWPSGVPPAWGSGEARPWPSQQQMREERQREMERRARERGEEPPARPAPRQGGLFGGLFGGGQRPAPGDGDGRVDANGRGEGGPTPEEQAPGIPSESGRARNRRKRKKRR